MAEATTTEPTFRRGRHLFFALIGLAHGPLIATIGAAVMWLPGALHSSAERVAIVALAQLCFPAFVAWLALAAFDTHSGVTIWPRRWRDLGGELAALFVALECCSVWAVWRNPTLGWELVGPWLETFTGDHGGLRIGLALVAALAFPLAEELVYRVLLQRALDGYLRQVPALVIQGAIFELVHVYVYGYGSITGVWFISGYLLGYAFQRTRSLAVPALLHVTHNAVYFGAVWGFNQ